MELKAVSRSRYRNSPSRRQGAASSLALADPNPNGPRRQQRGRAVPSRAQAAISKTSPKPPPHNLGAGGVLRHL